MVLDEQRTRDMLQNLIWDKYGKSVTFKKQNSPTYNTRGELVSSNFTSSTVVCVPYSVLDPERTFQPFGNLKQGDTLLALPHTVDVDTDDVFLIEGVNYVVQDVQPAYFPGLVGTVVRTSRDSEMVEPEE
jgi:hypothetical protein